jgi:hypothetical protein
VALGVMASLWFCGIAPGQDNDDSADDSAKAKPTLFSFAPSHTATPPCFQELRNPTCCDFRPRSEPPDNIALHRMVMHAVGELAGIGNASLAPHLKHRRATTG